MVLGNIIGKSSTKEFKFLVKEETKKFQYVKVKYKKDYEVLCQVVEIEKEAKKTIAACNVIGYKTSRGFSNLKIPLEPDSEVFDADDKIIKDVLNLEKEGIYFGVLDGKEKLKINLDYNKLITKHIAVLAKSGAGKSYAVGVLLEEIAEKNIPALIIDPHGEYSSLKYANDEDKEILDFYEVKPKSFQEKIQEYSLDVEKNPESKQLKIAIGTLSALELIHLLPAKLSNAQLGILYSTIKETGKTDFDGLIAGLEAEESNLKYTIINIIEYIKQLNIFSKYGTSLNEIIRPGKLSILNLRGVSREVQEVVVYKLLYDLFEARKNSIIPPFFLVVEEAHNFIPERSFGEAKTSTILRNIGSEGRKFGLGLCVVSQRPARVDKNVISQCSTQIILKLTNPNDIKAVSSSVEGITAEAEKEIKNLPIGTAMVVGLVELPLFVKVRARKTKHGGAAIDILDNFKSFASGKEVLNIIKPKTKKETGQKEVLIPCAIITCSKKDSNFNVLVNLNNATLITSKGALALINNLKPLAEQEEKILKIVISLEKFNAAALFSKSGLQFSDIYEILNNLSKKGYLIKENNNYNLSENLEMFSNLNKYSTMEKCDFVGVNYDEKLATKYNLNEIIEFLGKFVNIKSYKECWALNYI